MSDGVPPPEVDSTVEPAAGTRRQFVQRWVRRGLALVIAVVATVLVSFFTIDLGRFPQVKRAAEQQASKYLERPMHIGRLSALVTPGSFVLEDVVIEGRNPDDRPFMRISRIYVHVPWWTIFRRQLHVDLTLDDWEMVVESWPGNIHNIPRLKPKGGGGRPLPFTTTVDFVHARTGKFTYEDHATPWSVVAPNLSFSLVRGLGQYLGRAQFTDGAVKIQSYRAMATDLTTRFVLDGPKVRLNHIDLVTEGTTSHVNGDIDFTRWPEQVYNVNSEIDFSRMKEIFFTNEPWTLGGEGGFVGIFRMYREGGFQLAGDFSSPTARVNALDFGELHGSLVWEPTRFSVLHADADMLGGHTRFAYSLAPLRSPDGTTATFSADYDNLDLFDLDRLMSLRGLRLAGAAAGNISMTWRNGQFSKTRQGSGHTFVEAPPGVALASRDLPATPLPAVVEPSPFDPQRRPNPLTIGADLYYTFDPSGISFDDGWAATTHSFISFGGRMAGDGSSEFPFHVTSHDWQESDRLLASIMTALSGPTGAVQVAGRGTFDGVMTGSFSAPRIQGKFDGEALRVWDVTWGRASADIVIQGGYVEISESRITGGPDSLVSANGRFALGFRKDDAEEINATVQLRNWPIADLRHAFQLDDWPMDGTLAEADLKLTGRYRSMFGSGRMRIDDGRAWDESFDTAVADLELEGTGMRVSRIEMRKGSGLMRGAARIGWDGTYAFNADGEGVPVESLDNFRLEATPLSGTLRFRASGASEFDRPIYAFDAAIDDLFVGSEGIGAVTGRVTIADNVLTIERFLAASSRLQVFGTGTVGLDDASTADLRLRFQETALDPYLKFVLTEDVSPYTRMTVGGSLSVRGPLARPLDLTVETSIDDAALTLYDYDLLNDGPIQVRFDNGRLYVDALELRGSTTNLAVSGGADFRERTWDLAASGDAGLAILQLFNERVTTSGAATLNAKLSGSFDAPRLTGGASIVNGRLRPFGSPHSLESINGQILFEANAVNLNGLTGRIGSGEVNFGGSIALDGYNLAEFNLTTTGRSMRIRYPSGFNSTVDMNLTLSGPANQLLLAGTIDVLRIAPAGMVDPDAGWFSFATAGGAAVPAGGQLGGASGESSFVLALDIQVTAPPMAFIDTNTARIEGNADLRVTGTFDVPIVNGRVEITGGELQVTGNRFLVRDGFLEMRGPESEVVFDVAAEARPRVAGQTYTVNVALRGTLSSFAISLNSDPPLPEADVISLLFGGTPSLGTAEQRALGNSQELQQRMLQTFGAALLAAPITSRVGGVVERTGAFDTVQIVPVLSSNETATQQLNPSARITLGKRISPRVFLTYSRTLSGPEEEIILLEYDQSDRMSWVLSRNEDRTFALDFRIRYVF